MSLEQFQERILEAVGRGAPLRVRGGGTKDFYGHELRGELLDTRSYAGIIDYEPTELVVTVRCGTALTDLEQALQAQGQCLPFEPPHFGPDATVGGCIAAGLSGPRRVSAGALRDYVLGIKMIDGRGKLLRFGGQVMKNVAGYDVSRLLAGSLGTLGLIVEASIKVLPLAPAELSLRLPMPQEAAIRALNDWGGQPLPISASAWYEGILYLRLSGAIAGVDAAHKRIGGEALDSNEAKSFWQDLREQRHQFFNGDEPLWRIAVPPTTSVLDLVGQQMMEWGGGLRWVKSKAPAQVIRDTAARVKGHATIFRATDKREGCFAPLTPIALRVHRDLKAVFDPAGILNVARLYPDL